MHWKVIKSKNAELLNALESLDGLFVFSSRGYEVSRSSNEDKYFSIECILIREDPKRENIFSSDIFTYVRGLDENVFYGVIETEVFDVENGLGEITPSTAMTKFIVSTDYLPFYIRGKTILLPSMGEKESPKVKQATLEKFEVERFVDGWNRFNIILLLFDDFKYCGETEYQNKKFENAVRAIKYLTNNGFPEKRIINWDKNEILDDDIKTKLHRDVGGVVDPQFIQGNVETRFCKLVRFGFKVFMRSKRNLMEELIKLDIIDKKSGLYLFEIMKEPIVDHYVSKDTQTIRNNTNIRSAYTIKGERLAITRFIIAMRITKLEGFWELLRAEMGQHPKIAGFGCKVKLVPIRDRSKERYHFEFSNYVQIGPLAFPEIVEKLEDIKNALIRISMRVFEENKEKFEEVLSKQIETGYATRDIDEVFILQRVNFQFWFKCFEGSVPHSAPGVYGNFQKKINYEFGFEQKYTRKYKLPESDAHTFRMAFPSYFDFIIDRIIHKPTKLNNSDHLTRRGVDWALSGHLKRSKRLLEKTSLLLDGDLKFINGYNYPDEYDDFEDFAHRNERILLPYLDSKPVLCHDKEEYYKFKKLNTFFLDNFNRFENIAALKQKIFHPREKANTLPFLQDMVRGYIALGIHKEKDLDDLREFLDSLDMAFVDEVRSVL